MTVRTRQSVYDLAPGDETLDWYRKAIGELIARPNDDPTSWRYVGAVHGNFNLPKPPALDKFWDQCQHSTWYFLPWHRGYLAAFEALIAKTVEGLGGPSDWALPYWNYSADLSQTPDARVLPPAFRDRDMADGSPNWLWSPRELDVNGNVVMTADDVDLGALTEPKFSDPATISRDFGGSKTGFAHFGNGPGALELVPHNAIHRRIGGFMANPDLAALDPIFWLHHCNIDRLWEEWIHLGNGHENPVDPDWLTGISFDMHDGDGVPFQFDCAGMRDTTTVLHGYRYDSIPPAPTPTPGPTSEGEMVIMAAADDAELAGASEGPVELTQDKVRARVKMQPELSGMSFLESAMPTPIHVYLRLEGITGRGIPQDYRVMIDLEGDTEPPLPVGLLTTFGVANASNPDAPHGGAGLTQIYDITKAAERLKLTTESAPLVQVTFEKVPGGAVPESAPHGLEDLTHKSEEDSHLQVQRIGIYFR